MKEATPAEHAAFISQARRHPRSVRKVEKLLSALGRRLTAAPDDAQARDLLARAQDLLALIRPEASSAKAA